MISWTNTRKERFGNCVKLFRVLAVSINGETISKSQKEEEEVRDKRPLAEEAPRYRVLAKHVFCFYSYSVTPVEFVFLVIRTDKASFEKGIQKMRSFIVKVSRDINWGGKLFAGKRKNGMHLIVPLAGKKYILSRTITIILYSREHSET